MVKIAMSTVTMALAAVDELALLQATDAINFKVNKHGDDAIMCVQAAAGDVAPVAGSFTPIGQQLAVVAAGSVASEAGSFCFAKTDALLIQRTFGFHTARDLDEAVASKNNGAAEKDPAEKAAAEKAAAEKAAAEKAAADHTARDLDEAVASKNNGAAEKAAAEKAAAEKAAAEKAAAEKAAAEKAAERKAVECQNTVKTAIQKFEKAQAKCRADCANFYKSKPNMTVTEADYECNCGAQKRFDVDNCNQHGTCHCLCVTPNCQEQKNCGLYGRVRLAQATLTRLGDNSSCAV